MTDRELLELAAKAAGIEYFWTVNGNLVVTAEDGRQWNPLVDDGDALRLAVKLGLWVSCGKYHIGVDYQGKGLEENCSNDPYAATRRAIVRAAAEIGKESK